MGIEGFDPHNKKYTKVEELPDEKRPGFKNVSGEGFTTAEAVDALEQADASATVQNKNRSLKEKITGHNKISGVDILQEEAIQENAVFDKKRQEEKERIEIHLWALARQNVIKREIYLALKKDELSFLRERNINNMPRFLEEGVSGDFEMLRKNDNNILKLKEYMDSKGGESWYEGKKDDLESLQKGITEENRRAFLREELHKRHPDNTLFKTRWLTAPEEAENKKSYVSVFCTTNEKALDHIDQDGLKFAGEEIMNGTAEVTGVVNTGKMELEKVFMEVAPTGRNRRLSVFAVPEYRDPERAGAMGGMGNIVLELMVDSMVFDVEKYNSAAESIAFSGAKIDDPDFHQEALEAARAYWNSGMLVSEYLKLSLAEQQRLFSSPEILIPDTVSPEQIKVVSVLEDATK